MKTRFLIVLLIGLCGLLAVIPGCRSRTRKVTTSTTFSIQSCVLETNDYRAKRNLNPLAIDERLMEAAGEQSFNMAMLGKMSHELNIRGARTLTERVNKTGFPWSRIAENIAWNYPPGAVVEGWMNSSGHRRNILGDFTHIGVACSISEDGEPYYTQVFGKIADR